MIKVGQSFLSRSGTMYVFIQADKPNTYTRNPSSYGLLNMDTGVAVVYTENIQEHASRAIKELDLVPVKTS